MEQIFIDIREWPRWMKERFKNKDFISLEQLLNDYESIIDEKEDLKYQLEDKENELQEMKDFYL